VSPMREESSTNHKGGDRKEGGEVEREEPSKKSRGSGKQEPWEARDKGGREACGLWRVTVQWGDDGRHLLQSERPPQIQRKRASE